jgi:hypothetical protein
VFFFKNFKASSIAQCLRNAVYAKKLVFIEFFNEFSWFLCNPNVTLLHWQASDWFLKSASFIRPYFHRYFISGSLQCHAHTRLCLPNGLLSSGFLANNLYAFLCSSCVTHAPLTSYSIPVRPSSVWWIIWIVELIIMKFSSARCSSLSLLSKYSAHHSVP